MGLIGWRSSWVVQGRAVGEGATGALIPVRAGIVRTAVGERLAVQMGDGQTVIVADAAVAQCLAGAS
jgi:hypothetical protein